MAEKFLLLFGLLTLVIGIAWLAVVLLVFPFLSFLATVYGVAEAIGVAIVIIGVVMLGIGLLARMLHV